MGQPKIFVDAPNEIMEILKGKVGTLPLLLVADNDTFKDIQLISAKLGKIPGMYGYDDVTVFRFGFETIINEGCLPEVETDRETKEIFELDVFWTETFDPNDENYMVDSKVSHGSFDYRNGFEWSARDTEKMFSDDLKYVLMEMRFFAVMDFPKYQIWKQDYVKHTEEIWKKDFIPVVPGAHDVEYVNENSVRIVMENGFPIYTKPETMYEEIQKMLN